MSLFMCFIGTVIILMADDLLNVPNDIIVVYNWNSYHGARGKRCHIAVICEALAGLYLESIISSNNKIKGKFHQNNLIYVQRRIVGNNKISIYL